MKVKSSLFQSFVYGLTAMTLAGCQSGIANAEDETTAAVGASSDRRSSPSSSAPTQAATKPLPVRVSRSFFIEQKLNGNIVIQTSSGEKLKVTTPIEWFEESTTQSPPQKGALADFRDHPGCAHYQGADGVTVCFNMMGDVYSLGLNEKDVSLRGVEPYLTDAVLRTDQSNGCSYSIKNIKFVKATRSDTEVTLDYQGDLVPQSHCANPQNQVAVQFQFQPV